MLPASLTLTPVPRLVPVLLVVVVLGLEGHDASAALVEPSPLAGCTHTESHTIVSQTQPLPHVYTLRLSCMMQASL